MKQNAFTLLEILLVIAAIGILAAIVIVAINPQRQLAQVRNAQRRTEVSSVRSALEQYLIDSGSYPPEISVEPQELCAVSEECSQLDIVSLLVPQYIAAIPQDPSVQDSVSSGYYVFWDENSGRVSVQSHLSELEEVIASQVSIDLTSILDSQEPPECQDGYIAVLGNNDLGTGPFCVMKYEAKLVSGNAVSQPSQQPWRHINLDASGQACEAVDAQLIENAEWMTIARDIEMQDTNWSGGSVGDGQLNRGNTNNATGSPLQATDNDDHGCFGINTNGNTSPDCNGEDWHVNKRTFTLSNGEVIWDLVGNAWQWTNNVIEGSDKPGLTSDEGSNTQHRDWILWSDTSTYPEAHYGSLSYNDVRSSNPAWGLSQHMGRYTKGSVTETSGFLRGNRWSDGNGAGIYTLSINHSPTLEHHQVGFRCVHY